MRRISERFRQCGLEIHPTNRVSFIAKDVHRQGDYTRISFDFLGYTFRPDGAWIERLAASEFSFLPSGRFFTKVENQPA